MAVNLLTWKAHQYLWSETEKAQNFIWMREKLDRVPLTAAVDGTEVAIASVDYDAGTVALASAPLTDRDATTSALPSARPFRARRTPSTDAASPVFMAARTTRAFPCGNPDEPHCDWQSGLYDPTYFPDTGFARMGTEASAIAGYLKQYESQIIVKTGGAQEATSFARTFVMTEDGTSYFTLRQGAHGEALSRRAPSPC